MSQIEQKCQNETNVEIEAKISSLNKSVNFNHLEMEQKYWNETKMWKFSTNMEICQKLESRLKLNKNIEMKEKRRN